MNFHLALIFTFLSCASLSWSQNRLEQKPLTVSLSPNNGSMVGGQSFTITFPTVMVSVDQVDVPSQPSPFLFTPALNGQLQWKSRREARFHVTGPVTPGQSYRPTLQADLTDSTGIPVPKPNWSKLEFEAPQLRLTSRFQDQGAFLAHTPEVDVRSNYQIQPEDLATAATFQDRDTLQQFPASVILSPVDANDATTHIEVPTMASRFYVTPEAPLPVGGTYDLIFSKVVDAKTRTAMPGIKVFSLGTTSSARITETRASAPPLEQPFIALNSSTPIDTATVSPTSINIQPPVANLKVHASKAQIRLHGDFNVSQTYQVRLSKEIQTVSGFPLDTLGPFTAHFDGLEPMIVFPKGQFYQRCQLGLNVTVLQSNCTEATWKLAKVPMEKFAAVETRLKEFEETERDLFTGETGVPIQTELLTSAFDLPTIASGSVADAAKHQALYRNLRWRPDDSPLQPGVYLLEMTAKHPRGATIGNRSLVIFNEVVIHRKRTNQRLDIRVASMTDATVVADARVEVISRHNVVLAQGVTDAAGAFAIQRRELALAQEPPAFIRVSSSQGGGLQPFGGTRFFNGAWVQSWDFDDHEPKDPADGVRLVSSIVSDRNLYQPGESVKVKGAVRWQDLEQASVSLEIPAVGSTIQWHVTEGYYGTQVAVGNSLTDAFGGWEAEWKIAKSIRLGDYVLHTAMNDSNEQDQHRLQVQEYRTPLFQVELSSDSPDQLQIQSHYFHGGANAAALARWTAHWSPNYQLEDGFRENDNHSSAHRESSASRSRSGELRLDADGKAILNLSNPFTKPYQHARYRVNVSVDIISPEGQTISARHHLVHQSTDTRPSIRLMQTEDGQVELQVRAADRTNKHLNDQPMNVKVYFVESQSVKERLGPKVFRFRNFPTFHRLYEATMLSGSSYRFQPDKTGFYVATAALVNNADAPLVSDKVHSVGEEAGHYEILNDAEIALVADRERYIAGKDTATITLQTPFSGQAWICLETNRIIDQFTTTVEASNPTIQIPIKNHYHPNIYATVYLLSPGSSDRLPKERFGNVELSVDRPDRQLETIFTLTSNEVQPGEQVEGIIKVTSTEQPIEGADLTIFAVDAAVHELGKWQLPDWNKAFYRDRYHQVATYRGLDGHYEGFSPDEVTEKGFLIGGGGEEMMPDGSALSPTRKNFKARAFWQTGLTTNANGEATFSFAAPDNLTRYNIVALAQTTDHRFGESRTTVNVAKRLMIEPALPQFVRQGDLIEWRAVVRQDYLDEATVTVTCQAEGEIEWLTESRQASFSLTRGLPQVVRFPCRILGDDEVRVSFQAEVPGQDRLQDAVEQTLAIYRPGVLQRTGHYQMIPKSKTSFPLEGNIPNNWLGKQGHYQMTISYSPFLPELNSLPEVLDYPHGCLEQKSSRYLSYSLLADLLDYLPDLKQRHANYQDRLESGLRFYEEALLPDGFLPYWSGSKQRNAWVTVMAYWLKESLLQKGITVPERLNSQLSSAVQSILEGKAPVDAHLTLQAFALFTQAESVQPQKDHRSLYHELMARRDQLSQDGIAFLALAMQRLAIMPQAQDQLRRQLVAKSEQREAFDPLTFGSTSRTQTLTQLYAARAAKPKQRQRLIDSFLKHSAEQQGAQLSTQENYWRLLLLKELMVLPNNATFSKELRQSLLPDLVSQNATSLAWQSAPLPQLSSQSLALGRGKQDRFVLINAEVLRQPSTSETPHDQGFRLERVVKNLTDPKRQGDASAPFDIGDELLINYRFHTPRNNYYVALTDELPAAIETVNFNLPQIAQLYQLPAATQSTLRLSHSELRKRSANLYFNDVPAGDHSYSILARVTAVGTCIWPAAQIGPMYQPYFGGLTPAQNVVIRGGLR